MPNIVSHIDWECEVHRLYQEKNYGSDESGYIADTWAFSQTDKCIVLEDDVVPDLSFFHFCKEMLDRYENDERIMLISAQNLEDVTKGVESDYFFSYTTFTWGWASWARVVNQWDAEYSWLKNPELESRVNTHILRNHLPKTWPALFRRHAKSPKPHFETILMATQFLHEGLTIVPTRNAAANVGVGMGSAHYDDSLQLMARGERRIFTMPSYELDVAHLRHPEGIVNYEPYRVNAYRIRAWGHPWVRTFRVMEAAFYQILYGNRKKALQKIVNSARNYIIKHYSKS